MSVDTHANTGSSQICLYSPSSASSPEDTFTKTAREVQDSIKACRKKAHELDRSTRAPSREIGTLRASTRSLTQRVHVIHDSLLKKGILEKAVLPIPSEETATSPRSPALRQTPSKIGSLIQQAQELRISLEKLIPLIPNEGDESSEEETHPPTQAQEPQLSLEARCRAQQCEIDELHQTIANQKRTIDSLQPAAPDPTDGFRVMADDDQDLSTGTTPPSTSSGRISSWWPTTLSRGSSFLSRGSSFLFSPPPAFDPDPSA